MGLSPCLAPVIWPPFCIPPMALVCRVKSAWGSLPPTVVSAGLTLSRRGREEAKLPETAFSQCSVRSGLPLCWLRFSERSFICPEDETSQQTKILLTKCSGNRFSAHCFSQLLAPPVHRLLINHHFVWEERASPTEVHAPQRGLSWPTERD